MRVRTWHGYLYQETVRLPCGRENVLLILILDGLEQSDTLVSTNCRSDKLLGSRPQKASRQIAG